MKRGIGVEPDPGKGQHQNATRNSTDEEAKGNRASGAPAKPRSNTVATFLRPQQSPRNTSHTHRSRPSTAGYTRTTPARVQDRRHAFLGKLEGFVTGNIQDIQGGPTALSSSASDSTSSTNNRDSRTPRESGTSFSATRQEEISRRLSASARCIGTTSHQGGALLETASLTSGTESARRSNSQSIPPFEAFSARRSSQSATREAHESKNSINTKSVRQSPSRQELTASRRDTSAHCQHQIKAGTGIAASCKAKESENTKVGFTVPSDRQRLVPSSYLLSATRTRESLLVPGEGRAYHLGVQHGELHSRILTVGHAGRADWLAERFLDPQMRTLSLKSNRNFRLHSGYYKRKPVTIVAVGMGAPMMDVLVREASYITEGPLAIVRLGTCTLLDQDMRPGSIVVASPGSLGCYTNYAYFDGTAIEYSRTQELKPYIITRPCAADPELSRLIYRHAASHIPDSVFEGLNASAETFYSCQAREDQLFRDENEDLLETLLRCGAQTMDMETHQLLHLASRRIELMKAAAVHIGVTSRTNDHFMHPITPSQLNDLVAITGKACLDALADVTI